MDVDSSPGTTQEPDPAEGEFDLPGPLEGIPTGVLILDAERLQVIGANAIARDQFGLSAAADAVALDSLVVVSVPHTLALLRRVRAGLIDQLVLDTSRRIPDSAPSPIEMRLSFQAEPSPRYVALVLDIAERARPDELSTRRESIRDALAEILRSLTRIDDRKELFRQACRIAVERAGFRMAWVGLVDEETGEVVPEASAGDSAGYVEDLHLNVRGDLRGPGMTVTAINTGQPVAIADPRKDPMFTTLMREVRQRGFESALSLPLIVDGKPIGALTVYGNVVNAFGAIEVELLQQLADDISFKLEVIGREEARRALEAERDKLAVVVEQAGEFVLMTDREGLVAYTNPAFTRTTGYSPGEALGRPPGFVVDGPEQAEFASAVERAMAGNSWAGRCRIVASDGTERDMHVMVSPRRAESGVVMGAIVIGRDISRERQLEAQLVQSQKMEAVGRLAGGIAHDFNNLLTAISGYAELLKLEVGEGAACAQDIAEIQRASSRATQLTAQLLAFSRRQILRPQSLDPRAVLMGIAPMLRRLIGEDVDLVVTAGTGLGPVLADPTQLDQALVNLALNGRDAMPSGGRLDLEAEEVALPIALAAGRDGAAAGPYVVLRVRDAGTGMTPEVLSQAFEPFFTTKATGKGTGLGLSTVLGIVEQSNGFVEVDTGPGIGTTVSLYLPKAAGPLDEPAPAETSVLMQSRARRGGTRAGGTLLVVEDEEPVRALVRRVLEKAGYTVMVAATAEEALALEATHDGSIDLLFTDVILPGMTGRRLADEIRARRPALPVLYASGYNQEIIAERGILAPDVSYMAKPYSPDEVLRRVAELVAVEKG